MGAHSVRVIVHEPGRRMATTVAPGESWLAAARRTARSGDPVVLDLAGPDKHFVVDPDLTVALRPMTRGDLPDVARWRSAEHVRRWFAGAADLAAVTERYGPRIDGAVPTRMWVVEANGRSIGFCQDYVVRDHPDFAQLTPDPDAVAVDYAIGEAGFVGRGLGTRLVWAWLLSAAARHREVTSFFASPDHRNVASLRILQKCGFVPGTWFDEPQSDGTVDTLVGCTLDRRTVLG